MSARFYRKHRSALTRMGHVVPYSILARGPRASDPAFFSAGTFTNSITFGGGGPNEKTLSSAAGANPNALLAAWSLDRSFLWAVQISSVQSVGVAVIASDPDHIYVGINVNGSGTGSQITFESLDGNNVSFTMSYNREGFILAYDYDGNLVWSTRLCQPATTVADKYVQISAIVPMGGGRLRVVVHARGTTATSATFGYQEQGGSATTLFSNWQRSEIVSLILGRADGAYLLASLQRMLDPSFSNVYTTPSYFSNNFGKDNGLEDLWFGGKGVLSGLTYRANYGLPSAQDVVALTNTNGTSFVRFTTAEVYGEAQPYHVQALGTNNTQAQPPIMNRSTVRSTDKVAFVFGEGATRTEANLIIATNNALAATQAYVQGNAFFLSVSSVGALRFLKQIGSVGATSTDAIIFVASEPELLSDGSMVCAFLTANSSSVFGSGEGNETTIANDAAVGATYAVIAFFDQDTGDFTGDYMEVQPGNASSDVLSITQLFFDESENSLTCLVSFSGTIVFDPGLATEETFVAGSAGGVVVAKYDMATKTLTSAQVLEGYPANGTVSLTKPGVRYPGVLI